MAVKSNKGNLPLKKNSSDKDAAVIKNSSKTKKQNEEDSIDLEDDKKTMKTGKSSSATGKGEDDSENEEDDISLKKGDEDEDWDPDFAEFDLPKSSKKVFSPKKESKDSEDEFKVDEEFEDYFNSHSKKKYNDADDDY